MNAYQRRKLAAWHHSTMPLGCQVIVKLPRPTKQSPQEFKLATMFKHDKSLCLVKFADHDPMNTGSGAYWISYSRVRPVLRQKVRPWWRVMRNKHKGGVK